MPFEDVLTSWNWQTNKRTLPPLKRVAEPILEKARAHRDGGNPEAGIQTIKSVEDWDQDPRAWRIIGHCGLQQKRYPESLAAFERAEQLHILETAKDNVNKATAHMSVHAYDKALEAAEHARRLAPSYIT